MKSAMRYGEVLSTEDLSGVLFLLPPGHTRLTDWDYVTSGFIAAPLITGLKQYAFVNACETFLADTQERLLQGRPHYYLWGLAVDPAKQRGGSGTALLKTLFEKTDREGLPIYLETHRFENVAYYEQRGFHLIHTGTMPGDDLPFWCMLREPNLVSG
ncbi:MAG: GNAT family N-acetyltransferase [Clostridiales bacterium]|nr:GNAT family N-acetyltransferase [Clostridiales bacterium]